ncbi:hypothetical protein QE152_g37630 [Popillia japonica]|uniref:Uncharacterized protein n=1 Tax=Popillia japonica TaxID=7064 RepID=A0AAW1I9M2_POPJA
MNGARILPLDTCFAQILLAKPYRRINNVVFEKGYQLLKIFQVNGHYLDVLFNDCTGCPNFLFFKLLVS